MENTNVELERRMLQKLHDVNIVQARVEAENLRFKQGRWVSLGEEHVPLFPQLSNEYLCNLTYGIYQLKLSPSYIQDTILRVQPERNEEDLNIDLDTNEPGFIRITLFSRFRNAIRHQLWIAFDEEYVQNNENRDSPILGYYCKSGVRTLETCSHVATVIWFLGWA